MFGYTTLVNWDRDVFIFTSELTGLLGPLMGIPNIARQIQDMIRVMFIIFMLMSIGPMHVTCKFPGCPVNFKDQHPQYCESRYVR